MTRQPNIVKRLAVPIPDLHRDTDHTDVFGQIYCSKSLFFVKRFFNFFIL